MFQDRQVKGMLTATAYKKRKVKNAIDFVGHLVHFVFEVLVMLFTGVLLSLLQKFFFQGLFFVTPITNFTLITVYIKKLLD